MSEPLSELDLARAAYETWRSMSAGAPRPPWCELSEADQNDWYNRIGGYLAWRWEEADDHSDQDRAVRLTCQQHGGLE